MPSRLNFQNAAPTPPCNACSIWSHAGGIDADDQTPTKIIFDPLFSRFNDEFRRNEAIERTGNKSLARNEWELLGQTLAELLCLRTPPSDLCVFKSVGSFLSSTSSAVIVKSSSGVFDTLGLMTTVRRSAAIPMHRFRQGARVCENRCSHSRYFR